MIEVITLGSGSAGNAVIIKYQELGILIDAGFSAVELDRRLNEAGLSPQQICAILISHEHDDHVQGVRVFAKRNGELPVYANSLTFERLRLLRKAPENMTVFTNGSPFTIGAFSIEAFSICHDAVDPVGFIIKCQDRKIGIATDLGYAGKMVPLKLHNSHLLILESNHDPDRLRQSQRPPYLQHRIMSRRGHLSNQDAIDLLAQTIGPDTKHLIMAHLSDDCNHPNLVFNLVRNYLQSIKRNDIEVVIAEQNRIDKRVVS